MALKDKYFTVSEAAKELGVTRQTISRWISTGKIPAEKIGREKLILKKDIQDAQKRAPFINSLIERLRIQLGYSEEDKIEEIGHYAGLIKFLVTRIDGTRERLEIPVSKMELVKTDKGKYSLQMDFERIVEAKSQPKKKKRR
jgi:excisionase family DNA binding protein